MTGIGGYTSLNKVDSAKVNGMISRLVDNLDKSIK